MQNTRMLWSSRPSISPNGILYTSSTEHPQAKCACIGWDHNGSSLLIVSQSGELQVANLHTNVVTVLAHGVGNASMVSHAHGARCVVWGTPGGQISAVPYLPGLGAGTTPTAVNVASLSKRTDNGPVRAIAGDASGGVLAVAQRRCFRWGRDLSMLQSLHTTAGVTQAAHSHDGSILAIVFQDGLLLVWKFEAGNAVPSTLLRRRLQLPAGQSVSALAVHEAERCLVLGTSDGAAISVYLPQTARDLAGDEFGGLAQVAPHGAALSGLHILGSWGKVAAAMGTQAPSAAQAEQLLLAGTAGDTKVHVWALPAPGAGHAEPQSITRVELGTAWQGAALSWHAASHKLALRSEQGKVLALDLRVPLRIALRVLAQDDSGAASSVALSELDMSMTSAVSAVADAFPRPATCVTTAHGVPAGTSAFDQGAPFTNLTNVASRSAAAAAAKKLATQRRIRPSSTSTLLAALAAAPAPQATLWVRAATSAGPGCIPADARARLWGALLACPGNAAAMKAAASHGLPDSVASNLAEYGLPSPRAQRRLHTVIACAIAVAPALGAAPWLAASVWPWVAAFPHDDVLAAEATLAVLTNWGAAWLETAPLPPLPTLAIMDAMLEWCDPALAAHFKLMQANALHWAWPLLHSMAADALSADQWRRLWDVLLAWGPDHSLLPLAVIAIVRLARAALLALPADAGSDAVVAATTHISVVDIEAALRLMWRYRRAMPQDLRAALPGPGSVGTAAAWPGAAPHALGVEWQQDRERPSAATLEPADSDNAVVGPVSQLLWPAGRLSKQLAAAARAHGVRPPVLSSASTPLKPGCSVLCQHPAGAQVATSLAAVIPTGGALVALSSACLPRSAMNTQRAERDRISAAMSQEQAWLDSAAASAAVSGMQRRVTTMAAGLRSAASREPGVCSLSTARGPPPRVAATRAARVSATQCGAGNIWQRAAVEAAALRATDGLQPGRPVPIPAGAAPALVAAPALPAAPAHSTAAQAGSCPSEVMQPSSGGSCHEELRASLQDLSLSSSSVQSAADGSASAAGQALHTRTTQPSAAQHHPTAVHRADSPAHLPRPAASARRDASASTPPHGPTAEPSAVRTLRPRDLWNSRLSTTPSPTGSTGAWLLPAEPDSMADALISQPLPDDDSDASSDDEGASPGQPAASDAWHDQHISLLQRHAAKPPVESSSSSSSSARWLAVQYDDDA